MDAQVKPPFYLNSLEKVAKDLGEGRDLTSLGNRIKEGWGNFERQAKLYNYDILRSMGDEFIMMIQMQALVQLLYLVPAANCMDDVRQLREKDREYGGSWHKRGGQGAFMMLARKYDRIEKALEGGNLLQCIDVDARAEGILDDIGDLRRYLLLVLSWHREVNHPAQTYLSL